MNLIEFLEKYKSYYRFDLIEIRCENPNCIAPDRCLQKNSARLSIKKNGKFICENCPRREAQLGKKHSEESRKKMSESANKKWQTEWGKKQKKILAKKTAQAHSNTNFDKSKRKVLYISAKNNGEIRTCNSSGEFITCEDFLEKDPNILSYDTQVYYEINDHSRTLDFLIKYKDGHIKAIEVKPFKRINELANLLQLMDSEEYAEEQGWEFEVWSEKELGITSWKEATRRADEYRKLHYDIDYKTYRQEKDREKANRHYQNKIATDKMSVYCDYCKEEHSILRKVYNSNLKKNGRYICLKENGAIVGSKPKKNKNPYAFLGQKKCIGCDRILPLESFSVGKGKCKECRANYYMKKYHERKN